jgi:serine/threonine-protein kinase
MAPEQARGEPADARSDIYALGCTLYTALTGRPPFDGQAPATILHRHVYDNPDPPSLVKPGVSAGLDALVMHMLAKHPGARPQSAALVARWLDAELGTVAAEPVRPVAAAPTLVAAKPLRTGSRRRPRLRRAGATLALALAGAVVALALGSLAPGGAGAGPPRGNVAHTTSSRAGRTSPNHTARQATRTHTSVSAPPAGATGAATGVTPASPAAPATTGQSSPSHAGKPRPEHTSGPAAANPDGGPAVAAPGGQGAALGAEASDGGPGSHAHGHAHGHGHGGGDGGGQGHGGGQGWWRRWARRGGDPWVHRIMTLLLGGDAQSGNSDGQGD